VAASEIVGLIPRKAIELAAEFYLRCENFHPNLVLENRLSAAMSGSGLNEFLEALASPTPAPGGGSASAAAGAMAAALGGMVASLARRNGYDFENDRRFLASAVDRDAAAFKAVVAAFKIPKAERAPFVEEALQKAAAVPMEVAECARRLRTELELLQAQTPAKFRSDVETARALATAAITGAAANVRINLEAVKDEVFRVAMQERLKALGA
jgi:formiminotetrahydrofolate cyclodeaminase